MIVGKTPKVLVHTAHDIDETPLVTTLVGGWDDVLGHIFDSDTQTKWFDFHINPWGIIEAEIPIHYELLTDLALENPRKMVVATICNSARYINEGAWLTNRFGSPHQGVVPVEVGHRRFAAGGRKNVVFYNLSTEMKNLDVFLGNLTEKDREVFDNCACGAVHYSECLCLASLALNEILGEPNETAGEPNETATHSEE